MGVIKAFGGLNRYKDADSVYDVLSYALGSKFFDGCVSGNIQGDPRNVGAVAEQFKIVQDSRPDTVHKTKLHHFALSVAEDQMSDPAIEDLMRVVKDYFAKRHFQVIVVKHYASEGLVFNPHLHVIVNHCNLKGELYYGNDQSFWQLKEYLERVTHHKWKFVYARESDYE
ncbi:MAG: relaxase/mobilization nuclease domain-containing protein [Lachnospiraceae bacterium]|nr:relaxase/mobilization nuclease domain-containing protein [Lachnospiraceae bacterium]